MCVLIIFGIENWGDDEIIASWYISLFSGNCQDCGSVASLVSICSYCWNMEKWLCSQIIVRQNPSLNIIHRLTHILDDLAMFCGVCDIPQTGFSHE